MSTATQNMIMSETYQAGAASVLAQLTNCFYDPAQSAVPFTAIADEIGINNKTYFAYRDMLCGWWLGRFPNRQLVLVFSGITNYRQASSYLLSSNQTPAGSTLGAPVVGNINGFVQTMAATLFPGILASILAVAPDPTQIVLGAHSMGGCLADCFAALCVQNPSLNLTVNSLYKFGSPKTGNATFANGVNAIPTKFLFRLNDDPIPYFPDESNCGVNATYNADGSLATTAVATTSYYHAGISCQLNSDGSYVPGQTYRSANGADERGIIAEYWSTGMLPANHGSDKYYEAFQHAWNNQRRQPAVIIRRNREVLDDLPTFPAPAEVVAAGADLPSVSSVSFEGTPPVGGTNKRVPQVVIPTSTQGIVLPATGPRKPRVRNGDGRAHRKALRILQDLKYLEMQSARVANGVPHSGTQYLWNPLYFTGDIAASFADVQEYLRKITNT